MIFGIPNGTEGVVNAWMLGSGLPKPPAASPSEDSIDNFGGLPTQELTEAGSAVVKAHYGRYYKELEANEFRPAVPSITPG